MYSLSKLNIGVGVLSRNYQLLAILNTYTTFNNYDRRTNTNTTLYSNLFRTAFILETAMELCMWSWINNCLFKSILRSLGNSIPYTHLPTTRGLNLAYNVSSLYEYSARCSCWLRWAVCFAKIKTHAYFRTVKITKYFATVAVLRRIWSKVKILKRQTVTTSVLFPFNFVE